MRLLVLSLLWLLAAMLPAGPARSQAAPVADPAAATIEAPRAEDIRALADLLRDPRIQAWLQAEAQAAPLPAGAAAPPPPAPTMVMEEPGTRQLLADQLTRMRAFLHDLTQALPQIPSELGRAWLILYLELEEQGLAAVVLLVLGFFASGMAVEWLFWWATRGFRQRMIAGPMTTVGERLRVVGQRLVYGVGLLLAYAIGSIGAFLLFSWPPLLAEIVLGYLTIILEIRLVLIAGRILLAPGAERFRVVPMATEAARFWFVWSAVLVGWFFAVGVTLEVMTTLGVSLPVSYAMGILGGFLLLLLAVQAVWRAPPMTPAVEPRPRARLGRSLLTAYLVLVWLLLLAGTPKLFFIGIVVMLLPMAIIGTNRAVVHLLRPPGSETVAGAVPTVLSVCLERGLRALLLIVGLYSIIWILGIDLDAITASDTLAARLLVGLIHALVILLVAEFLWHLLRSWIDAKLVEAKDVHAGDTEEGRKRARLRTLLPIFRNILLVTLVVMAALMALAAMGIEIGPLVAGAGVVGVAVGFGAQTLVKDIISGMFYLLDDAFRVGEYIQSGSYKGTVESFSLRSVKLRHHRGPLYTVPFGELGAVQNMSRDWVIDKLSINVPFDTDLDQVKRIIKQVGKELAADPEFQPHIMETLKMQGVDQMGDFAIQIRMKMMTKPGEQFVIRRRAYASIKKAFAVSGIRFAVPTVAVAGGGGEAERSVAAERALDMVRPAPAQA